MIIINFLLFIICVFSFIGFFITAFIGLPWLSLFFFVLCFGCYCAFRLDHKKVTQPKEIILTYRNGDLQKEVDDDLPYFDRNNFNFN